MKECSRCTVNQEDNQFTKNLAIKNGVQNICKSCKKIENTKNHLISKRRFENVSDSQIKELLNFDERFCKKCNTLKSKHDFSINRSKKDGLNIYCKECIINKSKNYIKNNRQKVKISLRNYKIKNKENVGIYIKKYRELNKEHINKYAKIRRDTIPNVKVRSAVSSRLNKKLKRFLLKKKISTDELLGCKVDFFVDYIEQKFTEGMSWGNYGINGWCLDHIKPCAAFDLTKIEDQIECFNYKNYQPLWVSDNTIKSSYYNGHKYKYIKVKSNE